MTVLYLIYQFQFEYIYLSVIKEFAIVKIHLYHQHVENHMTYKPNWAGWYVICTECQWIVYLLSLLIKAIYFSNHIIYVYLKQRRWKITSLLETIFIISTGSVHIRWCEQKMYYCHKENSMYYTFSHWCPFSSSFISGRSCQQSRRLSAYQYSRKRYCSTSLVCFE